MPCGSIEAGNLETAILFFLIVLAAAEKCAFVFFFFNAAFHAPHTGLTWNIHSHSQIWLMIRWWWLRLCNSLYNWRDRPVWNYGDKSLLSSLSIHFELSTNRFVTRCRFSSNHLCICCAIIHNYYILSFRNLLSFISISSYVLVFNFQAKGKMWVTK